MYIVCTSITLLILMKFLLNNLTCTIIICNNICLASYFQDTAVASGAILENYKALKTKYDNLVESHKKFATILENIPQYSNIISST